MNSENKTFDEFSNNNMYTLIKRIMDFIIATTGIIILSPVYIIIAIAIKIDSKGPILFRQERVGLNGETFTIYKFRSMSVCAPNKSTEELTNAGDYITNIGKFLRVTSLDEIPQLFNILKGDMSLIGPRPLIPNEKEIHYKRTHCGVYSIRPGITGMAQINGRDSLTIDEKVELDYEYLKKQSLITDMKIFFGTIVKVLKRENISG